VSGKRAKLLRRLSDDRREYQELKSRRGITPLAMRQVMADPRHAAAIAASNYRSRHAANMATPAIDSGAEALDLGFRLQVSPIAADRERGRALIGAGLERRRISIAIHEAAARLAEESVQRSPRAQADEARLRAEGAIP
jgi:hypothetical protein